jgi:DNA polymerase-3 subunit alpha
MSFTHLHLHTEYSLLDGACRIEQLMDEVQRLGQTSVAVTDHGVMYGVIDFYRAAKKRGIKPIIGCEVYMAARTRFDKIHALDSERYHLILLCENETGYKNLIKLVSEGFVTGFYTKPRIDRELLEKYHEGLIALSACIAGEIPRALLSGDYEGAKKKALWYRSVMGENNFFLEIQDHGLPEQKRIIPMLAQLSRETGIPLVATNDVHYISKEDSEMQQVLICIQTNHTLGEDTGMEFQTQEFYLKSEQEMLSLFPDYADAVERTSEIAERCNVEFEFGKTKLPHFEVPGNQDHFEYLKNMAQEGMHLRYGENIPEEYQKRLDYELSVISRMGYVDYYLIVHDFINHARSRNIPVGPGRGSGAGSITAYAIGITGIDPMKYSLLFERFLNPERVSMPDFDVDFCYERRSEVIDYVIEKYGSDHVAQIVTFGTMAARAAVRDVGRVLGMPYNDVDTVAKLIPRELGITIEKAFKSADFRALYENDENVRRLIDLSRKVEGMPRHASTHAAGVVITRDTVESYVPLARNDESIVTQFTMTTLEELGLLKIDFLGLRTLTVIDYAKRSIKERVPDFSEDTIDYEDEEVFAMLSSGRTEGVFQFESAGMRSVLMGLKPQRIEDLIAVISLYRPGPMDSIPTYIANRHDPSKIRYKTPMLEGILKVTYGCMIYQEQVMEIFRTLAGYSYGRADIVRRAMSKKKHDVMERERHNFIYGLVNEDGTVECEGAVKRGVDEKTANDIFNDMSSFASYAFNKSHAAAYAFVAYKTAWLKCHYPCEFMAALISSVLDDTPKVAEYIAECSRLGIEVVPPHVNVSSERFTARDGKIYFGLLAVKNVGAGFIREIERERKTGGEFTSFYSFCKRMQDKEFNKRAVESLIKCGALDGLGANRRQMLYAFPEIAAELENDRRRNIDGQLGFFDAVPSEAYNGEYKMPTLEEMDRRELLRLEKEMTGLYLMGHPMAEYEQLAERLGCANTAELRSADEVGGIYKDESRVELLCIITNVRKKITKNNTTMAFVTAEDVFGSIEVIVFPKTYEQQTQLFAEGNIVLIHGRLSVREDEEAKLVCESVEPCPPADAKKKVSEQVRQAASTDARPQKKAASKTPGLFLRFAGEDCPEIERAQRILDFFDGNKTVYFFYCDTKKYIRQPFSHSADVNEPMLKELRRILGEDNVIYIE